MKKSLFSFLFLFVFSLLFSETLLDKSIVSYRKAVLCYENQEYGNALRFSEEAILYRKQQREEQVNKLKTSLEARRVQAVGDEIVAVLKILEERKEFECINIINSYLKKYNLNFFNNSMKNLLIFMESSVDFPEAHCLIGDIYKIEGEYEFAEKYYLTALEKSDVFDIPSEKYELLYKLAELAQLQNDFDKIEKRYGLIIMNDGTYNDKALINAMMRTIKQNKKDSLIKFFQNYRSSSFISLKAYNQLAKYYSKLNENEKALEFSVLSVITSFTKIVDVISKRNPLLENYTLENILSEILIYEDILEWSEKNNIWESFNHLANFTNKMGYNKFAKDLCIILAKQTPSNYWQKKAVLILEDIE